jgi:hypothetical protein
VLFGCDFADPGGNVVAGRVEIGDGERIWRFKADSEWVAGEYAIHVDPVIEDLAGNSFARVFDLDLQRPQPREEDPIVLRFVVPELTTGVNGGNDVAWRARSEAGCY